MTSDNTSSHSDSANSEWRLLAMFTSDCEEGDVHAEMQSVTDAAQEFNLAAEQLAQIEAAIASALRNVAVRRYKFLHDRTVRIRILLANNARHAAATQCWGFFLLERIADDASNLANGIGYLIDAFLYPEGNTIPEPPRTEK